MATLRAAIVGASGYSGEELVRLLASHPGVTLSALTSRQYAGQLVRDVVPGLPKSIELSFEDLSPDQVASRCDVAFLALPHGVSSTFAVPLRSAGKTVIDLSADFRLKDAAVYQEFYAHAHPAPTLLAESVYALPELHRAEIKVSNLLASPGCYPTSILLALAPALRAGWIDPATIVINSLSGVSGAGKKAEVSLLFGELNENMRAYGVPKHRHLSEIEQELSLIAGKKVTVTFLPHLVPLMRGMLSTITATLLKPLTRTDAEAAYLQAYAAEPFVDVKTGEALPEVRNIARTNRCELALRIDSRTNRLLLFSALDNLGKGAAGQAVQAFNVKFGHPETTGLQA
jgi:N-acetyl-gamma-glutamyl-phosphate reductase